MVLRRVSENFREANQLCRCSLLLQDEIRLIEKSQVTIQKCTCGFFGLESCSFFLEISKVSPVFLHQVMTTAMFTVLKRSHCLVYDSMIKAATWATASSFSKKGPLMGETSFRIKSGILSKPNSKIFSKTSNWNARLCKEMLDGLPVS